MRIGCSPAICVCPCGLKELATVLRVGRGPWVGTVTLTLILSSSLRRSEKRPVFGGSSSFWRCPVVTQENRVWLLRRCRRATRKKKLFNLITVFINTVVMHANHIFTAMRWGLLTAWSPVWFMISICLLFSLVCQFPLWCTVNDSALMCTMAYLVNMVHALTQKGGTEALGIGMLHPVNQQRQITLCHLAWEKNRAKTGLCLEWEVARMLSFNLRLLPQVNTGSHAITLLSPQES